ncbi:MAG: histidine kinase [Clostridiales bacterium]|nr:histidine kinase [Clostridiales bacterium]
MKQIKTVEYVLCIGNIVAAVWVLIIVRNLLLTGLCTFLAVVQTVYLVYTEMIEWKTMERFLEFLDNGEKIEKAEKLLEEKKGYSFWLNQVSLALDMYTVSKIHRNNAEIFNKQTELTALQSQINPHFLYNTLDTIRGQAMLDDNVEVAGMIETLAAFFRYSISRKGTMVTLRDELNNINNYMRIQQYRFNDRFSLEILIEEEDLAAYDFYVPRLILQPIVENAINHGLEDRMEGGSIIIEVTVADDLIITVSDNGKGMTLTELDELNGRIHSRDMRFVDERHSEIQSRNTGIALPNISRRIKLLYGDQYGLNIYSSIGCGTDVEIMMPVVDHLEELTIEKNGTEN